MCLYPINIKVGDRRQTVKCGKCLECLQAQSSEWALRIMLESKQYKQNCCITLTYDNEHVNPAYLLERRDIQLFIKSLRKELDPLKIRVFYSGEYGDKKGRPHFHLIVFNWFPSDCVPMFRKDGEQFYNSALVRRLWSRGNVLVGSLTYHTAFYCAKYLQKLKGTIKSVKPFVGMSLRPGIGYGAITHDMLKDGQIYFNGRIFPLPRYFQKVFEKELGVLDPFVLDLRGRRTRALYDSIRRRSDSDYDNRLKKEYDLLGKESWEFYKNVLDNFSPADV